MRARKTPSRPPSYRYQLLSMTLVLLISPDLEISPRTIHVAGNTGSDSERQHRDDLTGAPSIDSDLDHEHPMGPFEGNRFGVSLAEVDRSLPPSDE